MLPGQARPEEEGGNQGGVMNGGERAETERSCSVFTGQHRLWQRQMSQARGNQDHRTRRGDGVAPFREVDGRQASHSRQLSQEVSEPSTIF